MNGLIRLVLAVLMLLAWSNPAWAGTWTSNGFGYKPSLGARGETEKNNYDAGIDRIDARLGKEYWVGDPNLGSTVQAAVTALGSTAAILRVPWGPWNIPANLTIPANITLKPNRGAVLNVAAGATLTLNSFDAGLYQTFACTGTGKVVFGAGAVKEVWLDWWGPAADGATDDSPKLQAAIDSLATAKGVVKVGGKSYALAARVNGRFGVRVEGVNNQTVFVLTGTAPGFGQADDFYNNTVNTGYWIAFRDFTVDASANAHDLDLMYFDRHFNECGLQNIRFVGNPSQIQTGLHLYHTTPENRANYLYHNLFSGLNFINCKTPNGALFLEGSAALTRRANNNTVQLCKFTGYKVGVKIGGIGNRVQNTCFNNPDDPVMVSSWDNIEGLSSQTTIVVTKTAHGLSTGQQVAFKDLTQADWIALSGNSYKITYINSNSFSLQGGPDASTWAAYNAGVDPGQITHIGGSDFRAIFYDGYSNVFANNWLEQAADQVVAMMYGQGTGAAAAVCDFPVSSVQLNGPDQIADLATAGAYAHAAVYSAADTLVVEGADVHATYPAGRQVWVDCGADGWRTSTVLSSTYSDPDTTIVLSTAVLTANLATLSPCYAMGLRSNLNTGPNLYKLFSNTVRLYLGNGATHYLSTAIKGSTTYDFSAAPLTVNAGATASISLTASGAAANMAVSVNASTTTIPDGIVIKNVRTGTDSITVYFYNPTAGNITINTSQTFKWMVFEGQ